MITDFFDQEDSRFHLNYWKRGAFCIFLDEKGLLMFDFVIIFFEHLSSDAAPCIYIFRFHFLQHLSKLV